MEHQETNSTHYQILNNNPTANMNNKYGDNIPLRGSQMFDQENDQTNIEFATLPKGVTKQKSLASNKNKMDLQKYAKPDSYTVEWAEFDFESLKTSENFKIKLFPEAVYMGEIVDNKRHGRGVMKYF